MDVHSVKIGRSLTPAAKKSTGSQHFETFLKMLTTQIQNQDPLSPMQADQFADQLASFSMVEQQTLTNQNPRSTRRQSSRGSGAIGGWQVNVALCVGRPSARDRRGVLGR